MLAYILAIAVALASLTLYLSAFFLPELHRKDDFFWSSVGLFYALVLWVCAGRITGGVLLGQTAAVALIFSFSWQTVKLRRALAHPDEQTDIEGFSLITWLQTRLAGKKKPPVIKSKPQASVVETAEETAISPESEKVAPETLESEILTPKIGETFPVEAIAETVTEKPEKTPEVIESLTALIEEEIPESAKEISETIIETVTENLASETIIEAVTETISPPKKGFSFKNLFSFGQGKPTPSPQKPSITAALDKIEAETKREEIEKIEEMEEAWEDELDIDETPTLGTPAIISEEISETVSLETPAIISEEVTATESELPLESNPLKLDFEEDFGSFIHDDETETMIEDYQTISKSSSVEESLEVSKTGEEIEVKELEIAAVEIISTESDEAKTVETSLETESVSSMESISLETKRDKIE